jgi:hypothetical protein
MNFGEVGCTLEGLELLDFEGPNINGIDGPLLMGKIFISCGGMCY